MGQAHLLDRGRQFKTVLFLTAGTALVFTVGGSTASTAAASDTTPSAPRSVKASAGPASVEVSWRVPRFNGGAKIDGYKVVRSATGLPKRTTRVSARTRSVTIEQLVPGKTYSLKVWAHNARGWGKASRAVEATPLAETGFGAITGACGVVAPQLDASTPSFLENRFDFGDDWHLEKSKLTEGGQRIFDTPNAGGSSLESEIMAYELLDRCEAASLLKTETEIVYEQDGGGAITDLLVEIAGNKVGVNVTRAYRPSSFTFTQEEADAQLTNALEAIQESSQRVVDEDAWVKQVLIALAVDDAHADKIETAWLQASAALKGDTVLYLITTDGSDGFIYCNPDAATCP